MGAQLESSTYTIFFARGWLNNKKPFPAMAKKGFLIFKRKRY